MAEPAAKKNDEIISDETKEQSRVWVKPPSQPPDSTPVPFKYKGPIDNLCSSNVFIMGKPAATVGSTATNWNPPKDQPAVTEKGTVLTTVNNIATITTGSSTVYINGKKAARNKDTAKTWDYSTEPSPGEINAKEIENAKIEAAGSVYIGN